MVTRKIVAITTALTTDGDSPVRMANTHSAPMEINMLHRLMPTAVRGNSIIMITADMMPT